MGLELELDRDGPSNDERALRLEQERARELSRELELQKDTVSLDRGLEKVDALSDMSLQCLSETELDFIKREISEFAFIKTGNPANIQELEYDPDRNLVMARCNGRSLQIELDKEGFEKPIEIREKLSEVQSLEREHKLCVKNCGHLEDMACIATDQRDRDILMREIKIEQASQGLMGVWNKLTGQIPEPYPSLYEQPLTREDLTRGLLIADVRTDHFQQLLEDQLSEMQRYPQKIGEQLDRVVEQSREHIEAVKLETAAMVARHELERTAKQPEIEPQLEKPIEELTLEKPRLSGVEIDALIKDMPYDELMKRDIEFKTRALLQVQGISEDDLMKTLNTRDVEMKEDIMNIILAVNNITNEMTENGQRLEFTALNNTYRLINSNIQDCFDQANTATDILKNMQFNKKWDVITPGLNSEVSGMGHAWGKIYSENGDFITFDPRARSFGINRVCDSCQGWFGL